MARSKTQLTTGSLDNRFFTYALVAGAGLIGAAKPAAAGIVYQDPADQTYTNVGFALDLDSNGTDDVTFTNASDPRVLTATGQGVKLLPSHATIGPDVSWSETEDLVPATGEYLGVQFPEGSQTLYGWVRLDVTQGPGVGDLSATVKDWAYEDAGGSIKAGQTSAVPEPTSLGLMALGAAGLGLWRTRRNRKA